MSIISQHPASVRATAPQEFAPVAEPITVSFRRQDPRTTFLRRVLNLAATLLMITAIAVFVFLAIGPRFLGYQTSTMLTGSMAPEIMPGDVIVTTALPVSEVQVGDVITYQIPVDDRRVETHRVVEVNRTADGETAVRTKGDANAAADPWVAVLQGEHAYTTTAVVPQLGHLIRALRTPLVNTVVVYGFPSLLVIGALTMIWRKPHTNTPGDTAQAQENSTVMDVPVLDLAAVDNLADELDSRQAALNFINEFAVLLEGRVAAIVNPPASSECVDVTITLLSLNVGASMVGARQLERTTALVLESDSPRQLGNYPGLAPRLVAEAEAFQLAAGTIR